MITIKDIAAKSGVSVTTVSRVINNHPYVKDEVREKVLKVIEEEHFVPHEGAVSLAKTPENSIGIIVRGMGNIFFSEMFPYLERRIQELGYTPVMHQIGARDDEIVAAATLVKSRRVQGIIFLGGRFNYDENSFDSINVPSICCTYTNRFGSLSSKSLSSICIDDKAQAKKAVKILMEKGHKRIAIALPSIGDQSIAELRFQGYVEAFRDCNMKMDPELVAETGSYSMEDAYRGVKRWVQDAPDFTAIFAISDTLALAVIKALSESGKRVPEDVSVIAIDGIELTEYTMPTLTTLVQPKEVMAIRTVDILHKMIEEKTGNFHEFVDTTLRKGESVISI